jgi:hypothetical protein
MERLANQPALHRFPFFGCYSTTYFFGLKSSDAEFMQ